MLAYAMQNEKPGLLDKKDQSMCKKLLKLQCLYSYFIHFGLSISWEFVLFLYMFMHVFLSSFDLAHD